MFDIFLGISRFMPCFFARWVISYMTDNAQSSMLFKASMLTCIPSSLNSLFTAVLFNTIMPLQLMFEKKGVERKPKNTTPRIGISKTN
tara:strand:- start:436 stop:699 length:264 start_codon:yes stop_codon:yes gene_type:complete